MKTWRPLVIVALVLAGCGGARRGTASVPEPPVAADAAPAPVVAGEAVPKPPVARKVAHVTSLHGIELHDDYFWLRDKDTPEVLDYLKAENAYTAAMMKPTEALQQKLYDEMVARIKQTDLSVPYLERGTWYYTRTEEGKQYTIYCRKKGTLDAAEEVMLDVNELGKASSFIAVAGLTVSDDGDLLLYKTDTTGFRDFTLHVKDLRKGVDLSEAIPHVASAAWASDGKTLFYTTQDSAKRPDRAWRHTIGDAPAKDQLVYEDKDALFDVYVERTRSGEYILVYSFSSMASEVHYLRAAHPSEELRLVAKRAPGVEYYLDHQGDKFYILTNDKGRNFRLVTAPVKDPRPAKWKEIIAHRDDVMLANLDAFKDYVVIQERRDGLPHLHYLNTRKGSDGEVDFGEPIYDARPDINREYDTHSYRYTFTSLVTPESVFEIDFASGKKTLLKQTEVLGYDPGAYQQERIHATAADGTEVPISLVYRKGLVKDGRAPMLLTGYGAYGIPTRTVFDSNTVSLLDRGVVFAIAHVRGGGEMGKLWHEQGRLKQKMNTFTDFIACAEHLIAEKVTAADRLVIEGGSAGGLLVGAVLNLRPDLFKAAVARVPFVDAVNTMLDETLPLTTGEFEEWGNPKIKDQYEDIAAYSPYDNVAARAYPSILVVSSYNDSQVMYWEPAKWVARLRAHKTDDNPLLLQMSLEPAGHGGKSGRYEKLHQQAFRMAFELWQMGL